MLHEVCLLYDLFITIFIEYVVIGLHKIIFRVGTHIGQFIVAFYVLSKIFCQLNRAKIIEVSAAVITDNTAPERVVKVENERLFFII